MLKSLSRLTSMFFGMRHNAKESATVSTGSSPWPDGPGRPMKSWPRPRKGGGAQRKKKSNRLHISRKTKMKHN